MSVANISGYQVIEKLYESHNSLVYRARRIADSRSVILKTLKRAYPTPEKIAWFKREYTITKNLQLFQELDTLALEF